MPTITETLDEIDAWQQAAGRDTVLMSTRKRTSHEEKHYDLLFAAWPTVRQHIRDLENEVARLSSQTNP